MISVGIDVSKGKSTICILKPYGEIVSSPFDVEHTDNSLLELSKMLLRLDGETKVVKMCIRDSMYPSGSWLRCLPGMVSGPYGYLLLCLSVEFRL